MQTETKKTGRSQKRFSRKRKGAAAAELAVCLPALFLIGFGAIEATSMAFLRQAMVQSAYEVAKESVRRGGSQADGLTIGQQVLDARNITGAAFTVSPANVDTAATGTPVSVTVTAPGDANTVFPFAMFAGQTVTVRATMVMER